MTLARLLRRESSGTTGTDKVTDPSEEVMEERWVREAAEVGKIDERVVADEVPCAVVAVSPASGIEVESFTTSVSRSLFWVGKA